MFYIFSSFWLQSALAHSCIVLYNIKSAKFEHLFASQRDLTQSLQQRMEESWVGRGRDVLPFPRNEAKNLIRQLRFRLDDYLLTVQTEIIMKTTDNEKSKKNKIDFDTVTSQRVTSSESMNRNSDASDTEGPAIFGNAFGSNVVRFGG